MKMNFKIIFLLVLTALLASSPSLGDELKCKFSDTYWFVLQRSIYTCNEAQVSVNGNSISLEVVQGTHMNGKSNKDVKALYVYNDAAKIQQLPQNIHVFFPHIEALLWIYGNLSSLTADDLKPFPELKYLALGNNKIVSLDGDLFQHTQGLIQIEFLSNQITTVGYYLLANMKELKRVSFTNNPCVDIDAETPQEILELEQISVAQCPPLVTTTTVWPTTENTCEIRCTMNDEVDALVRLLNEQNHVIESLREEND